MDYVELFQFENDFVETLRCIPMAVRFKLDLCGVKVSLRQWSRFTREERASLLIQPCGDPSEIEVYQDRLVELIATRTHEQAKPLPAGSTVPWDEASQTPEAVLAFASSLGVNAPSDLDWSRLSPLRRFVLLKLSRDNHDNVNFIPALTEFGLYSAASAACDQSLAASA